MKGVNDRHIEAVVKKAAEAGAYMSNIMQLIPVKGSEFENLELVTNREIKAIRKQNEAHLKQMYHCMQCRADAVGTLENDDPSSFAAAGR
jgi:MoaA/NifB/PqqE/SkfB family radical SAM enzyme